MTVLDANLSVLRGRDPDLFDKLFKTVKPDEKLTIEPTSSGAPTAMYDGIYLHSNRNPIREADKFVDNWSTPLPQILIMEGFGLGYQVRAFLTKYPNLTIWVIEPDISMFYTILMSVDLRDILGHPGVIFFFNPRPESLGGVAAETGHSSFGITKIRSLYLKDQEFYKKIESELHSILSRRKVNKNTLKRFGRLWIRNLLKNLPILPKVKGIYRLKDEFKGIPALIIGAGPSLEDFLPLLPELQNRFLIISVDTAFGLLTEAGIQPDFVTVIDPQYWNTRHLDGQDLSNTVLISESATHPRIFRSEPKAIYFCGSHFPLSKYLEEKTDIEGKFSPGGSVATTAWEAARYMGAEKIYCAGLDLGFPGDQTHHRESFFEMRALFTSERKLPMETFSYNALHDASPYPVPDNKGGVTLTDQRMAVYIKWFENQIKRYPDLSVFNLSPFGTAIEGMEWIDVKKLHALDDIKNELTLRMKTIIDRDRGDMINPDFIARLDHLMEEFRHSENMGKRGLELCLTLDEKIHKNEPVDEILSMMNELDNEILNSSVKNMAGFLFQDVIASITDSPLSEEEPPGAHPAVQSPQEGHQESLTSNSRKIYSEILKASSFHLNLLAESKNKLKSL
ncbi:MAG: motility associated factor glycosyltransferase family protein [Spirochaetales bacterium]|nr:motility associated factor glycosyltransferase family protein [Spirochaetales bacterium]